MVNSRRLVTSWLVYNYLRFIIKFRTDYFENVIRGPIRRPKAYIGADNWLLSGKGGIVQSGRRDGPVAPTLSSTVDCGCLCEQETHIPHWPMQLHVRILFNQKTHFHLTYLLSNIATIVDQRTHIPLHILEALCLLCRQEVMCLYFQFRNLSFGQLQGEI